MTQPTTPGGGRGLLMDYGGVMTESVGRGFRAFERHHELAEGTVLDVILGAYHGSGRDHPVARYERGELATREFELVIAEQFAAAGHQVEARGIVRRLLGGLEQDATMWDVVANMRAAGVRTGLLSNSWGTEQYPVARLRTVFDVVLISGEIGVRKPDPEAFLLGADRLGLPPAAIVFVDDLERNVVAAEDVGMRGVLHRDSARTASRLTELLEGPTPST